MNVLNQNHRICSLSDAIPVAQFLAQQFAQTAVERDRIGGTPKYERDLIRQSGLLSLSIPKEFGGFSGTWQDTFNVVRLFAQADSSIAHVFGFHHLLLATVRLFGNQQQWQRWYQLTAEKSWFWGNALNPLDSRTVVKHQDGWYEFSGKKSFCSGALDSEMLIASGVDENTSKLLIAAVPTSRSGITLYHDWDNIGQRQTDSGSSIFERVRVEAKDMLLDPGPLSTPFSTLRPLIAQLVFVNMFLGVAEGALNEAKRYTKHESRAWFLSGVEHAHEDPYTLRHYGEFWLQLESLRLLNQHAIARLQEAWNIAEELTEQQRGEVAIAVATAKVAATRASLDITNRIFEVTGARATHAALRFDRFWRNVRTQTLHDPVEYKIKEIGQWALNDVYPKASFYS
ncbi:acyl-CoA dehydrogenase family protein [Acinetobacter sp. VNH17]|uniref:Acyl-CoA dehydrogenase family protein n=1 Tax=Acinetobacter thutiue TaxID=2998078 RepID=A0ABT7WM07_9GAMM|nr:acyl-CoA dehydrogenase family protein [Acinetobacter thutiue]MCY6411598.1 acyl-CoA dehydrogenase family protein [Acinetobacter thutiue]MDN0013700.1 acyl-CoA dehydrogenase family protein [Acinetobacter thutiue]